MRGGPAKLPAGEPHHPADAGMRERNRARSFSWLGLTGRREPSGATFRESAARSGRVRIHSCQVQTGGGSIFFADFTLHLKFQPANRWGNAILFARRQTFNAAPVGAHPAREAHGRELFRRREC